MSAFGRRRVPFRERGEEAFEALHRLLDAHRRRLGSVGRGLRARSGAFGPVGSVGIVAGARRGSHERKRYDECEDELARA